MSSRGLSVACLPAILLACLPVPASGARPALERPVAGELQRASDRYAKLPMAFEPNLGQSDERVRYLARGHGYAVFVTGDEVVLALPGRPAEHRGDPRPDPMGEALRMRLAGAAEPRVEGDRALPGKINYLVGEDESGWLRDVPTYGAVRWASVYEGVDAVFYGTQSQLEYDFVVAPGADAGQIRVRFEGHESAEVDESGDLVLRMKGGEVRQPRAAVFEQGPNGRRPVAARYVMTGDGEFRFDVGAYDPSVPLVIDPALVYSSFLGGSAPEQSYSVAVDASGNAYVTGETTSPAFPTTSGALKTTYNGGAYDAFVTKLSNTGETLAYSTYLGGIGDDYGQAVAVDASGNAYLIGTTGSGNFPTTSGAFDTSYNGGFSDAYVAKLSASGNALVYSTLLGGLDSDLADAIAIGASGTVLVTGHTRSTGFPTTTGAFDRTHNGNEDVFVTKLQAAGNALVYSTYLGGSGADRSEGIAVDAFGEACVAGHTTSTDFPTTAGVFDTTHNGGTSDAFVTRFVPEGTQLVYSTYLGGSGLDYAFGIAMDGTGRAFVAGQTDSTNFPTTAGALDASLNGNSDAFVTRIATVGNSLVYSTYLGGNATDVGYSIAIDASGAAYVTGTTLSATFPTTAGAFDTSSNGEFDAFATKLSAAGNAILYSTFLGGMSQDEGRSIAVDASGAAYVTGNTSSTNFPTTPDAVDTTFNGAGDVFVTKLSAAGSVVSYSTYLGGSANDQGSEVAVDGSGATYVVGSAQSTSFPTTLGGFDTTFNGGPSDVFVAKVSAAGNSLVYSTYLGGNSNDYGYAIAVDGSGAAYVTGRTFSTNFTTTVGAFDTTLGGSTDAFVTKLHSGGNALAYSTYLGGADEDYANDVAVDAAGAAYVTGITYSTGFPTVVGSFDTTHNGSADAFVTKVSAPGTTLAYSTFLGGTGSDASNAVAVDASGAAYVAGNTTSTAFPTTAGAFDTTHNGSTDAFVAKVSAAGTALAYSTFLGGSFVDFGNDVAVDAAGAAYVTGYTFSTAFPTTAGAFDTTHNGGADAFVTKLSAAGDVAAYSTYLGADNADFGLAIAVDTSGAAFVTGHTISTTFPTTLGAADTTHNGGTDLFVTKFSAAGASLDSSTFLGGGADDEGHGIVVDSSGAAYVAGTTTSANFAISGFGTRDGASGFVLKLVANSIGVDTPGIYLGDTGSWFLRNSNSPGGADLVFGFGPAGLGWLPLHGDWDGDDTDTIGLYDPATGNFFLRNQNAAGGADLVFSFGPGGAGFVPMVGDWNGDGVDTIGAYDPGSGAFFLRNQNAAGGADLVFTFGAGGLGLIPLSGDWDGDGTDSIGLYDPSTGFFFIRNTNGPGGADHSFSFGPGGAGIDPVVGDYDGDGDDTIGIYIQSTGTWFLKQQNRPGGADLAFTFGPANARPLIGDWDRL